MYKQTSFIKATIYNNTSSLTDDELINNVINTEKWNDLKTLNGDFCGAVKKHNKWILFRDHMGINPLFYYIKDDSFYFSEDIRDLCSIDSIDLSINDKWFYLTMTGRISFSLRETEFKHIFAICPGTWNEFELLNNKWTIKENVYWSPGDKRIRFKTDKEYISELRQLIESSVKMRMEKFTGRIGAESSGGLDSSIIDLLVCQERKDCLLVSWSLPYDVIPMKTIDERQVLEDVCKAAGTTFQFVPHEYTEECDCKKRFLPAYTNTTHISRTAKLMSDNGVSIVFTGHGGDEGVSHRCSIAELWYHGEYWSYIREIWYGTYGQKLRFLRTGKRLISHLKRQIRIKQSWYKETDDLSICLNPDFLNRMSNTPTIPLHFGYDPKQYIMDGGSRSRIDNCAIQASDYGVKYVFPFLDYRLIDFALSIPRRLYLNKGQDRYIYREAFKDIMPKSLYDVDYKDFPSLRHNDTQKSEEENDIQIDEEYRINEQGKWADAQLSQLDWSRWNKYFDKEACKSLLMADMRSLDTDKLMQIRILMSKLYTCSLIQNLQDNGSSRGDR